MSRKTTFPTESNIPLVFDFDGTLHHGDLTWEAALDTLRRNPLTTLWAVWAYVTQGKAAFKLAIESARFGETPLQVAWNEPVLSLAREALAEGREVWIATGSAEDLVQEIVEEAGLDIDVIGTTEEDINLTGRNKAEALLKLFGEKEFDYVGNSADDLPVWAVARKAILVNTSRAVSEAADAQGNVGMAMASNHTNALSLFKAIRPHQWLKNALVFVPLITAHLWASPLAWMLSTVAFVAFSLCASGVYILNDLLDIQDDRAHPRKRNRPLAAGTLSIPVALAAIPTLTAAAFALAWAVSPLFTAVLGVYWVSTVAYSFYLKSKPMADVLTLAGLYCLRVVAGGVAAGIALSFWLLLFALMVFFSLANMKRVIELQALAAKGKTKARGYYADDTPLVLAQGTAGGLLGVMVLALYLQSPAVAPLYGHPVWLGLLCPLMMFWLARAWLIAWRGNMHDDPVVFAAKDPASWLIALTALVVMVGAV